MIPWSRQPGDPVVYLLSSLKDREMWDVDGRKKEGKEVYFFINIYMRRMIFVDQRKLFLGTGSKFSILWCNIINSSKLWNLLLHTYTMSCDMEFHETISGYWPWSEAPVPRGVPGKPFWGLQVYFLVIFRIFFLMKVKVQGT